MKGKTAKINKTLRLDPNLLNQAKKILGYKTYTEAIEDTLKTAINNRRHGDILNRYAGKLKSYRSFYE
ncbi:MAG: hypothetical protein HY541_03300 [Deltaproteobacteria bacterium]|nr:hypothetical protein [Deltaproteobacteria bacterium]